MISRAFSFRFITVAATCVFLIVGILAYRSWIDSSKTGTRQEEQISQRDMEIIRNLGILRNLDTIQRVVNYVDEAGGGLPAGNNGAAVHGMNQKNRGTNYA